MINKKIFWIVLLFPCMMVLIFLLSLHPIGYGLIVNDPLQKVDLITAVSGPEYRIVYAAELYKKGLGQRTSFSPVDLARKINARRQPGVSMLLQLPGFLKRLSH